MSINASCDTDAMSIMASCDTDYMSIMVSCDTDDMSIMASYHYLKKDQEASQRTIDQ